MQVLSESLHLSGGSSVPKTSSRLHQLALLNEEWYCPFLFSSQWRPVSDLHSLSEVQYPSVCAFRTRTIAPGPKMISCPRKLSTLLARADGLVPFGVSLIGREEKTASSLTEKVQGRKL